MKASSLYHQTQLKQLSIAISAILLAAAACFVLNAIISYQVVALILMVSVSVCAIFFEIKAVLTAAVLSALIWNFFFIPPRFTLAISKAEDALLFLMYFVIALLNAVFTTRIRKAEKAAAKKKEEENAIRLYNTLLNSLSHELKTPISTIIAATDNLQAMAEKLTEHNKFELIAEISKAGLRLNRQVENLLNMSRLEAGYLKPKNDWIDILELVNDVCKELNPLLKGKPIQVQASANLPLVQTDYGLLFHVLHNLLHNAVTYIPKYAVITLRISVKPNTMTIVVEDTGNGFPEQEIEKVFNKFYRLEGSSAGGTGLGLSIVKGFIEAMHGNIALENMEPAGARFTINLPVATAPINFEKHE